MPEAIFAIPGDVRSPTGGYEYDRRVLALLPSFGVDARHVELAASFPDPEPDDLIETQRLLAGTSKSTTLLIDGLAYGAMPETLIAALDRRIIALVHHPLSLETGISPARKNDLERSETAALKRAERIIVTSEATKALLEGTFNVAPGKIIVAQPGTDPAPRASGTRMPLQLLAVGSITPRKAYDVLVKALAKVEHTDWRLSIVGATDRNSTAVKELENLLADLGFEEKITLTGKVVPATLDSFYEAADVFVMASHFEGYGMVLAEAMMRGLPIVCTTGGAARTTVPDGVAVKVPPGDVDALAAAMQTVLTDKRLRRRLADASWETGRTLPSWHETARRVAAVILGLDP